MGLPVPSLAAETARVGPDPSVERRTSGTTALRLVPNRSRCSERHCDADETLPCRHYIHKFRKRWNMFDKWVHLVEFCFKN
jgi:hypothetical protein